MTAGDTVNVHTGPHGLTVLTVESTSRVTPQITLVSGVLGTDDAAEIATRVGDIDNYKRVEPRRSARQDRGRR